MEKSNSVFLVIAWDYKFCFIIGFASAVALCYESHSPLSFDIILVLRSPKFVVIAHMDCCYKLIFYANIMYMTIL